MQWLTCNNTFSFLEVPGVFFVCGCHADSKRDVSPFNCILMAMYYSMIYQHMAGGS